MGKIMYVGKIEGVCVSALSPGVAHVDKVEYFIHNNRVYHVQYA